MGFTINKPDESQQEVTRVIFVKKLMFEQGRAMFREAIFSSVKTFPEGSAWEIDAKGK